MFFFSEIILSFTYNPITSRAMLPGKDIGIVGRGKKLGPQNVPKNEIVKY